MRNLLCNFEFYKKCVSWWRGYEGDGIHLCSSYEVRLRSLVLKDEFFSLMDEIKSFIGTLTAAGKGIFVFSWISNVLV